jgi:hypothetical protein
MFFIFVNMFWLSSWMVIFKYHLLQVLTMLLNNFLYIDLLCFWFFIGKTLQWLVEGRWMFEGNLSNRCYGLSNTLSSNIQLPYVDHYFIYVFGEQNLVILLQGSSPSTWVFLDNLKVNINLPLKIQEHWVTFYNLVTLATMMYWFKSHLEHVHGILKKI